MTLPHRTPDETWPACTDLRIQQRSDPEIRQAQLLTCAQLSRFLSSSHREKRSQSIDGASHVDEEGKARLGLAAKGEQLRDPIPNTPMAIDIEAEDEKPGAVGREPAPRASNLFMRAQVGAVDEVHVRAGQCCEVEAQTGCRAIVSTDAELPRKAPPIRLDLPGATQLSVRRLFYLASDPTRGPRRLTPPQWGLYARLSSVLAAGSPVALRANGRIRV